MADLGTSRIYGNLTVDNDIISLAATINRVAIIDASNKLISSTVTTTELGYLSGVTSSIQTQLGGKAPTSHAANANTYGYGDATNAGHLRVGTGLTSTTGTVSVVYGSANNTTCIGNDARLSDDRIPTIHGSDKHSVSYESTIAAGTTAQYWRGDKTWQALNWDAVASKPTTFPPDNHNLIDTTKHPVSGLTAGHVLRASAATAYAFAQLSHADLGSITANQHHNQSHVLATNTALGADHTMSGATAGHVLRASSTTAASFAQLQHADLGGVSANQHHNQNHAFIDSTGHTASGLTAGHFLKALTTTTYGFAAHGLTASDVGAATTNHNLINTTHHPVSGLTAGHVVRASAATTYAFAQLSHSDLGTVTADQHHAQSHAHSSHTGIGTDDHHAQSHAHSTHSGIGANDHHNQNHALVDTTGHTASALTTGHFLKATGATTYGFAAHGLSASDVSAEPANANIQTHIGTTTTPHVTSTEKTTWNGKSDLALGTTETTAYRGDHGLAAYNHSQATHQNLITNGLLAITATGDWNNYTSTGFYMGSNLANAPSGIAGTHTWWYVTVSSHDTSYCTQTATDFHNVATLIRTQGSGIWGGWKRVGASNTSGTYEGLTSNDGTDTEYLRAPVPGLIPHVAGGSGNLGTPGWPWLGIYGNIIYEGGTDLASKYAATALINQSVTTTATPTFNGINTSGFIVPSSTSNIDKGMYGLYDAARTGHIWSIGSGYKISATGVDFGNAYGLAYKHSSNTSGGTMAGGHQIVVCNNGIPGVSLGMAGGVWTSGQILTGNNTAYTTFQCRNISCGTAAASGGGNGDVYLRYI